MNKKSEKIMKWVFLLSALVGIISLLLICFFLFGSAFPATGEIGFFNFIFGQKWKPSDIPASFGIFSMILGSVYITLGAIVVGVPIGVLTAVFLARFCPKKIYKILKPAVNLLAGIPSVIYGFFGLVVLVPMVKNLFGGNGNSMLTAMLLLGFMILPTIIGVAESAIRAVPQSYYEGGLALGATHERAVFFAMLPAAKSGIMAAVVLGVGRAIGETMAVIMVAGNQTRMPAGLLKGIRTMTANIVIEMGYATDLHRQALISTGAVLFAFILLINFAFARLKKRGS